MRFFYVLSGKKLSFGGLVSSVFLSSAKVFLLSAVSVDSGFSWVGKGVAGVWLPVCGKAFVIRWLCRCVATALWCVCKQGFFWMKRSLVWSVKKSCLRCKEALFENGGNKRCFRGLQWVSHRGGVVKTGVSRSYRKLIRLWRMEGNGHYH